MKQIMKMMNCLHICACVRGCVCVCVCVLACADDSVVVSMNGCVCVCVKEAHRHLILPLTLVFIKVTWQTYSIWTGILALAVSKNRKFISAVSMRIFPANSPVGNETLRQVLIPIQIQDVDFKDQFLVRISKVEWPSAPNSDAPVPVRGNPPSSTSAVLYIMGVHESNPW